MPKTDPTAADAAAVNTPAPAPVAATPSDEKPAPVTFDEIAEELGLVDRLLLRLHMPKEQPTTRDGWLAALTRARAERI